MTTARLITADPENLTGLPPEQCRPHHYIQALHDLETVIDLDPTVDRLVVGVNPALAYIVHDAVPYARIVTRAGDNGADEALCEVLDDLDLITRRYAEVIVASGDHAFTEAVATLAHHGITTTVASLPRQLSRRLRLAAHNIIWLARPAADDTGEVA